jgi:SAM-dependent methyltransferase
MKTAAPNANTNATKLTTLPKNKLPLYEWFGTPLGSSFLHAEKKELDALLPNFSAGAIAKIGGPVFNATTDITTSTATENNISPDHWQNFLAASKAQVKLLLVESTKQIKTVIPEPAIDNVNQNAVNDAKQNDTNRSSCNQSSYKQSNNHTTPNYNQNNGCENYIIQCSYDALPLRCDSLDVAVLHHVLEFTTNPRAIIEEAQQILAPSGKMVIIGFNLYSLWGIKNFFSRDKNFSPTPPIRFIGRQHIYSWLDQLGMTLCQTHTFYFRLPRLDVDLPHDSKSNNAELPINVGNHYNQTSTGLLEKLGRFLHLPCGACYIVVAEKTATSVTPIAKPQSTIAKLLPFNYLKPSPQINMNRSDARNPID